MADAVNDIGPDQKVHSSTTAANMPEGYKLVRVPRDADVTAFEGTISSNYSVVKVLIALGQALYSTVTLYLSKGDRTTQYGCAAFGLTVAPYAVMSIVNLLGNLVTPEYPTLYLAHSPIMDEATRHTGHTFDGAVGSLTVDESAGLSRQIRGSRWRRATPTFKIVEDTEFEAETKVFTARDEELNTDYNAIAMTACETQTEAPSTTEIYQSKLPGCETSDNHYDNSIHHLFIPEFPPYKKLLPIGTKVGLYEIDNIIKNYREKRLEVEATDGAIRAHWRPRAIAGLTFVASMIPIAIIGGLTNFEPGSSTALERGFTMAWLVAPIFFVLVGQIPNLFAKKQRKRKRNIGRSARRMLKLSSYKLTRIGIVAIVCIVYGSPAVRGAVVVTQELLAYGTCVRAKTLLVDGT